MSLEVREVQEPAGIVDADLAFVRDRVRERMRSSAAFFETNAAGIAACAAAMADRFCSGATLLVFGAGPHATDAQHNAVEFVHPVLPGCRALPALALSDDIATVTGLLQSDAAAGVYAHQVRLLGRSGDIALAFAPAPPQASIAEGLRTAQSRGMVTIALSAGATAVGERLARFEFHVDGADLQAAHELHLATYHMLWELVHIMLNMRGVHPPHAPLVGDGG